MKVRFSLPSSLAGLIYFFFTALPAAFFAELLAAPLAVLRLGLHREAESIANARQPIGTIPRN
jgi:hypothetical protein